MNNHNHSNISIIIPAKNEYVGLSILLPKLLSQYPYAEVIVVNDGSNDDTPSLCADLKIKCINHPYCKGNGAAVKTGANAASKEILIFLDADGQHNTDDINKLLTMYQRGYHMVIGARAFHSQASIFRGIANKIYNVISSWVVGHQIPDLTSGFRVVNRQKFTEFLHLLPNGFSYPTTITMAFFRAGYSVGYTQITAQKREGKSHIRPIHDGARFLLIIFRIGTLYSPLKIFLPLSFIHFLLGILHYGYTFMTQERFTNMSALLFTTAVIIFLIGLVSEQITSLIYSQRKQ